MNKVAAIRGTDMGLFSKIANAFNADGIREAMRDSYDKHYRLARSGKILNADDPHYAGLFGALGSRYRLQGKFSEQLVFLEVLPFWNLPASDGREALAEYVVYMERSQDAKLQWLSSKVQEGLKRFSQKDPESYDGVIMMAEMQDISWHDLSD